MTTGTTMPVTRPWRRVGDARVPAAVLTVLADPERVNSVVVGGAGGVARQTSDAGWDVSDPGIGVVATLAWRDSTLLAGGAHGLARSTDDGRTWRPASVHGVVAPVTSIAVAGADVLAATLGSGVLRSTDGGRSWTPAAFGLVSRDVSALASLADGVTVIAGTDAGIHVSPNGGRAWRHVSATEGARVAVVAAAGASESWAVGEDGEVLVSADGGRSWTQRGTLPSDCSPSSLVVDHEAALIATSAGILHSDDGGRTWRSVHPGPAFCLTPGPGLLAGTDAGLVEGVHGGRAWSAVEPAPPVHDVAHLVPAGDEVLAYGPMSGVVRCRAGEPVDGAPVPVSVVRAGPDGVVLAAGPGGLTRSTDEGGTWTTAVSGEAGNVSALAPAENNVWWATSADGGQVLRSADAGQTWESDRSPWGTALVLALTARADTVLAATYDATGRAVDLWRRRIGTAGRDGWSHTGRVPSARPAVHLSLDPAVAVFDGRWMYGEPGGGWRPGPGPDGRLRRLVGAGDRLVALTDDTLVESTDRGRTWAGLGGVVAADVVDVGAVSDAILVLHRSGELWATPA